MTFLGMRELPHYISDFEMKAFFTFDGVEREAIKARRGDSHKLGLALHIGFQRMSGRLLYAFRVVPVALWRYLSDDLGIATSNVGSLRTLYGREKTLVADLRPNGKTQQSWLWSAPAKLSTRQISEVLERIDLLYALEVHKHLTDIPDLILRRYARRLASRPSSAGVKIKEPARTVEVACLLRYCLFATTDQLILMVQRRIAVLWRQDAAELPATVNWAVIYKTLLGELEALSAKGAVPDAELRARLESLVVAIAKLPGRPYWVHDPQFAGEAEGVTHQFTW